MNYNSESTPPSVQKVLSDILASNATESEKARNSMRETEQSNCHFIVIKNEVKKRCLIISLQI